MKANAVKTIHLAAPPHVFEAYSHVVCPLAAEDGGGFVFFTMPDFPGLLADGASVDEAVADGREALLQIQDLTLGGDTRRKFMAFWRGHSPRTMPGVRPGGRPSFLCAQERGQRRRPCRMALRVRSVLKFAGPRPTHCATLRSDKGREFSF
ncbi:MAG: type II toxin-antitoxin system HicB family antitoxin [Paucibacter sp.]|nr:type II toxin-antitoxin system HicB family antitoxin [Roseateles sp.]